MSRYAAEAQRIQATIADLEAKLYRAYAERRDLMREMDKTMTRREIGAVWGISNVAATYVINGRKFDPPKPARKPAAPGEPPRRAV